MIARPVRRRFTAEYKRSILDHADAAQDSGAIGALMRREGLYPSHLGIANSRNDALQKVTTDLARRFHTIGIEDLNVRGMTQNNSLTRAVADMGLFEFLRQLQYKAKMRGGVVVVANRWFSSSKICSACGHKLSKLPLAARAWTCPGCGAFHGRDLNAAINLKNMAVSSTASACGEEGSGPKRKPRVKPASMKQDANNESAKAGSDKFGGTAKA